MQKYSLAHLTVLEVAPPDMVEMASRIGYDYVSLRLIPLGVKGERRFDLSEDLEMARLTRAAMQKTGIGLLDIELARIVDGVDVASYEPCIAAGAELGAKHVLSSIWTDDHASAVSKFGQLCDIAARYGMTVNLEFVTWASVRNLAEASAVIRESGRENCGIMIDTLHFNRSNVTLKEIDELPRNWFNFAHLCDGPKEIPTDREGLIFTGRDARLYVGEGGIDIAAILNRAPEMPYSIELPHLARVKEYGYEEHARRCLESAKSYFAKHPRVN